MCISAHHRFEDQCSDIFIRPWSAAHKRAMRSMTERRDSSWSSPLNVWTHLPETLSGTWDWGAVLATQTGRWRQDTAAGSCSIRSNVVNFFELQSYLHSCGDLVKSQSDGENQAFRVQWMFPTFICRYETFLIRLTVGTGNAGTSSAAYGVSARPGAVPSCMPSLVRMYHTSLENLLQLSNGKIWTVYAVHPSQKRDRVGATLVILYVIPDDRKYLLHYAMK